MYQAEDYVYSSAIDYCGGDIKGLVKVMVILKKDFFCLLNRSKRLSQPPPLQTRAIRGLPINELNIPNFSKNDLLNLKNGYYKIINEKKLFQLICYDTLNHFIYYYYEIR